MKLEIAEKTRSRRARRIRRPSGIFTTSLVHITDTAVSDAGFQDHRSIAQRQTQFVQRIELQRERGLDLGAARPISLMAIGWKTTISPLSSPRISIRSSSRMFSPLGPRVLAGFGHPAGLYHVSSSGAPASG